MSKFKTRLHELLNSAYPESMIDNKSSNKTFQLLTEATPQNAKERFADYVKSHERTTSYAANETKKSREQKSDDDMFSRIFNSFSSNSTSATAMITESKPKLELFQDTKYGQFLSNTLKKNSTNSRLKKEIISFSQTLKERQHTPYRVNRPVICVEKRELELNPSFYFRISPLQQKSIHNNRPVSSGLKLFNNFQKQKEQKPSTPLSRHFQFGRKEKPKALSDVDSFWSKNNNAMLKAKASFLEKKSNFLLKNPSMS